MYQAIVFLPLIGFLIAGLFGRLIGARQPALQVAALMEERARVEIEATAVVP